MNSIGNNQTSRREHVRASSLLLANVFCFAGLPVNAAADDITEDSPTDDTVSFGFDFEDVKDCLVIIESEDAVGSGFIAEMEGKHFVVTNQHVVSGYDTLKFKTLSGKTLRPTKVELSRERDIARFQIQAKRGLKITSRVKMDDEVVVLGNSQGAGVITEIGGRVNGIGADRIEVDAEFVEGNSGSPVLNQDMEICGIATYVLVFKETKVDEGTKWANNSRRFAYRIDGTRWIPVKWTKYNEIYGKNIRETDLFRSTLYGLISDWMEGPDEKIIIDAEMNEELRRWAKQHNFMVNQILRQRDKGWATQKELSNVNKKIRKDMLDSAEALMKICAEKKRYLSFLANRKEVTAFLKGEFEWRSAELDRVSDYVKQHGQNMSSISWFKFGDGASDR